jgi:site-specific DNA-methyltransferase (adenine-specific)
MGSSARLPLPFGVVNTLWKKPVVLGRATLVHGDAIAWLDEQPDDSLHAVVTDPPYGVKEYEPEQLTKRAARRGGVWRIPPVLDARERAPVPRFTALTPSEREAIARFFTAWGRALLRPLRPGAHVFVAGNAFLSQLVFGAIASAGLEFRGQVIRLVRTLRGGDRPKNAEREFPRVTTLPRGCYEPWGIFRKPLPKGMTVAGCLRRWQTGALRDALDGGEFRDVIESERTPRRERRLAEHPSLKPQSFLRKLVWAALPLGEGLVVDTFMGSGSTLAAAEAVGLASVGVERDETYFDLAKSAVLALAKLPLAK